MKKVLVLLIAITFIPFVIYAGGQSESVSSSVPSVDGVVEYFEGEVTINGETADFGMKVPYGAIIKTGADSYCEVVFENKNIFRIMESTVVDIHLSNNAPEIAIEKGAFAALFTKLTAFASDEPLKVKTQTAVAGVRGTAFFVKVENPDSTYICICNGKLEMSIPDEVGESEFAGTHHKAAYYKRVNGKIEVSSAPLLYHNDDDMNSLAGRIDEKINWDYSASY